MLSRSTMGKWAALRDELGLEKSASLANCRVCGSINDRQCNVVAYIVLSLHPVNSSRYFCRARRVTVECGNEIARPLALYFRPPCTLLLPPCPTSLSTPLTLPSPRHGRYEHDADRRLHHCSPSHCEPLQRPARHRAELTMQPSLCFLPCS